MARGRYHLLLLLYPSTLKEIIRYNVNDNDFKYMDLNLKYV